MNLVDERRAGARRVGVLCALIGAGVAAGLHALGPVIKFLVLPFLLYYFEKSARGGWVISFSQRS